MRNNPDEIPRSRTYEDAFAGHHGFLRIDLAINN